MAEKAILSVLAGLTKGIKEGLVIRKDRETKEKELESKQVAAHQEMQMKLIDQQLKISTAESRNQYYKEMADQGRRKLEIAEKGAGIKSSQAKGDTQKDFYSQLNMVEKNLLDAQERLSQVETDRGLKKRDPEAHLRQYEEAKGNVDSLTKTRKDLKTKIEKFSNPGKVTQKQSQKFLKIMEVLDKGDVSAISDPAFSSELESLQGEEREKAAEKLSDIME